MADEIRTTGGVSERWSRTFLCLQCSHLAGSMTIALRRLANDLRDTHRPPPSPRSTVMLMAIGGILAARLIGVIFGAIVTLEGRRTLV